MEASEALSPCRVASGWLARLLKVVTQIGWSSPRRFISRLQYFVDPAHKHTRRLLLLAVNQRAVSFPVLRWQAV